MANGTERRRNVHLVERPSADGVSNGEATPVVRDQVEELVRQGARQMLI